MRIAIGSDHAGFELKEILRDYLRELGHEVTDLGTDGRDPIDYPDIATEVARELMTGRVTRGVLICGSGVGVSVAANKFPGVRAGLCHDAYSARQGVEHDDMNVLVLGARVVGTGVARDLAGTYISAKFTNEARHVQRLRKVRAIETGENR